MTKPSARRSRGNTVPPGRPLRILLAEDNRINQQFASLVLTDAGHSVEIAGNGRLAVEAFVDSDFDVVLMDIQMPEVDGVEATRRIRALPQPKGSVPIIAVTAHVMAGAREEYLHAGMDDYISKPYQPAELLLAVARASREGPASQPAPPQPETRARIDSAQIHELPVLDLEQLDTFASVLSKPKIRTLASLYLLDVNARLALIDECRGRSDYEGVSRQAHIIVSTAGNLGLKRASALARLLEESCADPACADRLIEELRTCCHTSSAALRRWLDAGLPTKAAKAG